MQLIDNFSRLNHFKSTFGINQQYTGTASSYIKQSQLKKRMAVALPSANEVYNFVQAHFRQSTEADRKKLIAKIETFISKIPDMPDAKITQYSEMLDDEGIFGLVIFLSNNLSKKIKYA